MGTQDPLRILSLDGGGVRGISSLYMLKDLMAQVNRQYRLDHPDEPACNSVLAMYLTLSVEQAQADSSHSCWEGSKWYSTYYSGN